MMGYDVVVVGGGSAGCVLAARLSEDDRCRVLLLEAGPDYPTMADLPADVADASVPTTEHDWGFLSEPDDAERSIPLPRARLMGGCSATNATFMLLRWAADYDSWADAGNDGWSFEDLLPLFRSVEADADFSDEWHGGTGPIPVRRTAIDDLAPMQRAFLDAAAAAGHQVVEDQNRPGVIGVGPVPRNVRDGIRMSTALTHIGPARSRSNLEIRAQVTVDRVELAGERACGVRLVGGEVIEAARVVLAAGAYASPAILMRTGIGPAVHLREVGVRVAVELPGVGHGLTDHPLVSVDLPTAGGDVGAKFQVMLIMRSPLADLNSPPDLHLFAAGPFDSPEIPSGGVFGIVTGLLAPRSRGSVRLRSADPLDPPRIDVAHLRHPDDVARVVAATLEKRAASHVRHHWTVSCSVPRWLRGRPSVTTTSSLSLCRFGAASARTTTRSGRAPWVPLWTDEAPCTASTTCGWPTHR